MRLNDSQIIITVIVLSGFGALLGISAYLINMRDGQIADLNQSCVKLQKIVDSNHAEQRRLAKAGDDMKRLRDEAEFKVECLRGSLKIMEQSRDDLSAMLEQENQKKIAQARRLILQALGTDSPR